MEDDGPVEVLQAVRAEIEEREAVVLGLLVLEERVRGLREQDLAAVAGVADAFRPVDGEPVVPAGGRRCLTCVDPDADTDLALVGPGVCLMRSTYATLLDFASAAMRIQHPPREGFRQPPLHCKPAWGVSSAGRAPALQAGGHRFDPGTLHLRKPR